MRKPKDERPISETAQGVMVHLGEHGPTPLSVLCSTFNVATGKMVILLDEELNLCKRGRVITEGTTESVYALQKAPPNPFR